MIGIVHRSSIFINKKGKSEDPNISPTLAAMIANSRLLINNWIMVRGISEKVLIEYSRIDAGYIITDMSRLYSRCQTCGVIAEPVSIKSACGCEQYCSDQCQSQSVHEFMCGKMKGEKHHCSREGCNSGVVIPSFSCPCGLIRYCSRECAILGFTLHELICGIK